MPGPIEQATKGGAHTMNSPERSTQGTQKIMRIAPFLTAWKISRNDYSMLKRDQKLIIYLTNFIGLVS